MTQGDKLRQIFGEHFTDDMMINHNRANCNQCILKKYCDGIEHNHQTCKDIWQMFLESEVK